MTVDSATLLAAIDRHLGEVPSDRSTVTAETMRDALLDLRNLVAKETPEETAEETPEETAMEASVEAAMPVVDDPAGGFAEDFPDAAPDPDIAVDPVLTGLDLAREVEVPAEDRREDFADESDDDLVFDDEPTIADHPADQPDEQVVDQSVEVSDEDAAADAPPETETAPDEPAAADPEPAPEPEPSVHLRLATSSRGVIARCGQLVEASSGDSSTPWLEDVTCGDCLTAVTEPADPSGPGADEDEVPDATDPGDPQGTDTAQVAEDDGDADQATDPTEPTGEASWVDDDDDGAVIHQLIEVKGSGNTKDGVAKCGHVETVAKADRFHETSSWPDTVTCAACAASMAAA